MKNISNGVRLSKDIWTMMKYGINIRNSVLGLAKVFLMVLVALCFGLIGVVSWTNPAHALKGGLPVCEDNLKACTANLNTCSATLGTCNNNLEAWEAEPHQIFPGDGYANPDSFGVSGHGSALSYTDNGDGTFTDNNTKLIWEKKTNVSGSVHNVNNTYTWSSSGAAADGTLFTVFLNTLNNKCSDEITTCTGDTDCTGIGNGKCGFAGNRDWRIPNIRELQSVVDYSAFMSASSVPGITALSVYYSVTTDAVTPSNTWGVIFGNGIDNSANKNPSLNGPGISGYFARAVRP